MYLVKILIFQDNLLNCVAIKLPQLMDQHPVGLIVIDSIAAVFRLEMDAIGRAYDMRQLVLDLQKLSSAHGCAVVCVNQVNEGFLCLFDVFKYICKIKQNGFVFGHKSAVRGHCWCEYAKQPMSQPKTLVKSVPLPVGLYLHLLQLDKSLCSVIGMRLPTRRYPNHVLRHRLSIAPM